MVRQRNPFNGETHFLLGMDTFGLRRSFCRAANCLREYEEYLRAQGIRRTKCLVPSSLPALGRPTATNRVYAKGISVKNEKSIQLYSPSVAFGRAKVGQPTPTSGCTFGVTFCVQRFAGQDRQEDQLRHFRGSGQSDRAEDEQEPR